MQSFFVFQQIQPTKMKKSENNEKTDVEVKRSVRKRNLMIIFSILILLVIGLSIALAFLVVMRNKEVSEDAVMMGESLKSNDDEVNLEALVGTHTGRMIAKSNETEAVIDYRLVCSHGVPHHHSLLNCSLQQVGCATLKEVNNTGDEEECLMEDMEFTFDLDRDGNFYTNDSELFDPVRLAVALYSKHLRLSAMDGKVRQIVEKNNSSHAFVSYGGLLLEVMELPENLLKKSRGRKRTRKTLFAGGNPHDFVGERTRRAVSTSPILKGAFAESFKSMWNGGPYMKVPSVYQKSGREGIVRYDFSLTNFEILLSTLPDIRVTALSKSSGSCTLNLQVDFSQNGQCTNVIQSRVKVYLNVRACIWFFCFARVKKDDYVTLDFTPLMEVSTTLTTQPGNKLQYSFELERFHSGTNSDIGSINLKIHVVKVIGLALFGPLGFLAGFLVDHFFERILKNIYSDFNARVPGLIDSNVEKLIMKSLPRSGMIQIPNILMGPLRQAISSCNNVNTLTIELSKIGGFLQYVPAPFQPTKIQCSGNGRILTVHDNCMHDYGTSGSGDHLEIYCYRGAKRFCLSNELCPWRSHRSNSCAAMFELATCSVSGLSSISMATTWGVTSTCRQHCRGWWIFRRCSTTCTCSGSTYRNIQCHKGSVRTV